MTKRTFHFVGKAELKPLNLCGKNFGFELSSEGGIFIPPVEMAPTECEHNLTNCEGCRKHLLQLENEFSTWFEGKHKAGAKPFPYCCQWHENLLKVKEFNRIAFEVVPGMAARKVIYTNQHIINNHNSENWYKKITDYIAVTVESFGQMPLDCGEPLFLSDYFFYVTQLLERNKDLKADTKTRLLEYLSTIQTTTESPKTDLNVLLSTYDKWLKEFPFELNSYFGNLKQHFEKHIPLLNGKPEVNMYSGIAKTEFHTKSSLFETLLNTTDSLLTRINGATLYEKGLITDANKVKLELVLTSRKQKLKQGYKNSSPSEGHKYRKMIKDWFDDEKKFFDEITPLLTASPLQPTETKTDRLKAELGKHGFFELPKVQQLLEPKKQSLVELISANDLPYSIAMFEYLGFMKHLQAEYYTANSKLFKEVAKWFSVTDRAVKGNFLVLNEHSKEDRRRYTAHQKKEITQKDYEKLK